MFARKAGCAYAARPAGQATFGAELAIPGTDQPQVGGERRPRIRVGSDGRIFVITQTRRGLAIATSSDHGRTWVEARTDALTHQTGADVFNAALASDGTFYVLWSGERDPKLPDDQVAQHLYLASSSDGARTFTTPRAITKDAARACPCCVPAITTGKPGEVWIGYRSSIANVKETLLLRSADAGKTFTGRQLSHHRWVFEGCPMAGPSLAVAGSRAAISWTSDGNMYTAASSDGGGTFSPPERLGSGRFNQIAASAAGQILQVWDEGHQTGVWWRDDPRPSPRVDIAPGGVLVAAPDGHFELLVSGLAPHHHGR